MVVFLDLDDNGNNLYDSQAHVQRGSTFPPSSSNPNEPDRPNPNLNAISAALNCYPIISEVTYLIDLNTLHALSRTCRQIRANLLQYRTRLVQQTLRCQNDLYNEKYLTAWTFRGGVGQNGGGGEEELVFCGRDRECARDMVSECRKCGSVVCRNCTSKPPPPSALPSRLRRLCAACMLDPVPLVSPNSPCACAQAIHFCHPCGVSIIGNNTSYQRVLMWRERYKVLSTGIGEGNEGVKCWRGVRCLDAQEVELESEVEEDAGEAGYWKQEIEGVGGAVKAKGRRKIKIGGPVKDGEGDLAGERMWCGWCDRVVLGWRDREPSSREAHV